MPGLEDELRAERARLLERLSSVPDFAQLQLVERLLASLGSSPDVGKDGAADGETVAISRNVDADPRDIAYRVLQESSSPMTIGALLRELTSRGAHIGGSIPRANLSTLLSRDDRFHSVGRDGWTLTTSVVPNDGALQQAASSLALRVRDDVDLWDSYINHKRHYAHGLPRDIDRLLLEISYSNLSRRLTEDEKHRAREFATERLDRIASGNSA